MQTVVTNKPTAELSTYSGADHQHKQRDIQSTEILRVLDLSKTFYSGFLRRPFRAINGVSFTVERGSIFAVLGHNGAGKTTTINCILDLVHADSGSVTISGQDNKKASARARIGYLPERPYFFEHLSGRELLQFYCKLLDIRSEDCEKTIADVLNLTGMTHAADRRLRKYSKGMLQRIGLAQALLGDPELLILDEPMSGLDPLGRRDVRELLVNLRKEGKTIILSSHIVPDVEMLADSVVILNQGKVALQKDLTRENTNVSYKVGLGPNTANNNSSSSRTEGHMVQVNTTKELRSLLDDCELNGRPVLSVNTTKSGLEDLFLSVTSEAGGEK